MDSVVLCLGFQAASPTGIFVVLLQPGVRKDTVTSAHCFLPDTEDRHPPVNHNGEFTKQNKNKNHENDAKVTKP